MGILVEDTFTEASNMDLASHTPSPTGTAWAELEDTDGAQQITLRHVQDYVRPPTLANERLLYDCTPTATDADVDVEGTIGLIPTGDSNSAFLFCRSADKDNLIGGLTYRFTAAADKKLFEKVSGTVAELASGDNGLTVGDLIKVEVRGTTAKLFHDTGGGYSEILSATTAVTAAGKGGLGFGNILVSTDDMNISFTWTAFKLTEFAANGDVLMPQVWM